MIEIGTRDNPIGRTGEPVYYKPTEVLHLRGGAGDDEKDNPSGVTVLRGIDLTQDLKRLNSDC